MEQEGETQGTLGKAIDAGKWSAIGLVVQKAIGFVSFFVLARLLAPNDYGLITVALMVVGIAEIIFTPDFGAALIQKKENINQYLNVFWTFNLLRAVGVFLFIFLTSPLVAIFFRVQDPLAISVLRLSGLMIVIRALGNMGSIFFFKELDFKKLFFRDTGGQIAFSVIAILWALYKPSVLALFFGYLGQEFASMLLLYYFHHYRPRISFHFRRLLDLIRYGTWTMGKNIVGQVNANLETMIIGRSLGVSNLGLYSRANNVVSLPSSALFSIIYKVGFPTYAKVQNDQEKIRRGFLKSFDVALITMIPFMFLILLIGRETILVLLGKNWLGMVPAMKVLVIALTFEGFSNIIYPLLEGVGRANLRFKLSLLQLVLAAPLLIWLSRYGLVAAASAMLIISFVVFFVAGFWLFRYLKIKFSTLARPLLTVVFASGAAAVAASPLYFFLEVTKPFSFIVLLFFSGLVYLGTLVLVGRSLKSSTYETLRGLFAFLFRARP